MSARILQMPYSSDIHEFITDMLKDANEIKDLAVYVETKNGESYVLQTGLSPMQMAFACKLFDRKFDQITEENIHG